MDVSYWKKRWIDGHQGFHESQPHEILVKHYDLFNTQGKKHFLLPLCGKTLDIDWLLQKGHNVTGVEVSSIAIEDIRARRNIDWKITKSSNFTIYKHKGLTILQGDYFALTQKDLPPVDCVFDRAAYVAIEPRKRDAYARIFKELKTRQVMLVLFRFAKEASTKPPFAFQQGEIQKWMAPDFEITHIESEERLEKMAKFKARGIDAFYRDVFFCTQPI